MYGFCQKYILTKEIWLGHPNLVSLTVIWRMIWSGTTPKARRKGKHLLWHLGQK